MNAILIISVNKSCYKNVQNMYNDLIIIVIIYQLFSVEVVLT